MSELLFTHHSSLATRHSPLATPHYFAYFINQFSAAWSSRDARWTVIVGAESDLTNPDDALFHWMANTAPDRDRVTSVCGRRIAFDATPKIPGDEANGQPVREWPPLIAMSALHHINPRMFGDANARSAKTAAPQLPAQVKHHAGV